MAERGQTIVGILSDTHGLMRDEVLASLRGCHLIVHAGDIGGPEILAMLNDIAPVTAVRGNNDTAPWAGSLQETAILQVQQVHIAVVHDLARLRIDPRTTDPRTTDPRNQGCRVVVSGHSHKPGIEERDGVMFLNPGSAGPRRFKLPIAWGLLTVQGPVAMARIVSLDGSLELRGGGQLVEDGADRAAQQRRHPEEP